jgi:hypothetical protein
MKMRRLSPCKEIVEFGRVCAYTSATAHGGKSREGDHNGQEDLEEGEEDGSDEVVESGRSHHQALIAIFGLDSGSDPSPAGLKSSDFLELLPARVAALVAVEPGPNSLEVIAMAKKTLKKAKKMEATKPLTRITGGGTGNGRA